MGANADIFHAVNRMRKKHVGIGAQRTYEAVKFPSDFRSFVCQHVFLIRFTTVVLQ